MPKKIQGGGVAQAPWRFALATWIGLEAAGGWPRSAFRTRISG
jgi:hypothetical protein